MVTLKARRGEDIRNHPMVATRAAAGMTNKRLRAKLRDIHSALDDALGDSDIDHMNLAELRDAAPVQWAATKLALLIDELVPAA